MTKVNQNSSLHLASHDDFKDEILKAVKQTFEEQLSKSLSKEKAEKSSELLTNKDIQKLFHVSLVTIHNWRNKGILRAIPVGGRVYYDKNEVYDLINKKSINLNGGNNAKQN